MVHVVLPEGFDDPDRPSGGNHYDRRIRDGLAAAGEPVRTHRVDVRRAGEGGVAAALAPVPDDEVVIVDGLLATAAPRALTAQAGRLRLLPLLHMVIDPAEGDPAEEAVVTAASAIITTSTWTRDRLRGLHDLGGTPVHVCCPGADPAAVTEALPHGPRLLSIGAVTPVKGHDVLVAALAALADLDWSWRLVGPLDREPEHARELRAAVDRHGLRSRVTLAGGLDGDGVAAALGDTDLLVHPSRQEAYGMVVTEALARGVPVVTTTAGGLPEALGETPSGGLPGMLIPPEDEQELGGALRRWLEDADLRDRLRAAARERRSVLPGWQQTVAGVATAVAETLGAVRDPV